MVKYQDITGKKFSKLIAKKYLFTEKGKSSTWLCECDCGNKIEVALSSLRSANTQSCGCLRLERLRQKITTHNKSHTPEYIAWGNMVQRCTNENNPEFKNYGERGITISDEWVDSFENFLSDMGKRPHKNYSLDRIDNNKSYSKENCRWADKSTQAINSRSLVNKSTGIKNISYCKRDNLYAVEFTRKGSRYRKQFKKIEDAIAWKKETLNKLDN